MFTIAIDVTAIRPMSPISLTSRSPAETRLRASPIEPLTWDNPRKRRTSPQRPGRDDLCRSNGEIGNVEWFGWETFVCSRRRIGTACTGVSPIARFGACLPPASGPVKCPRATVLVLLKTARSLEPGTDPENLDRALDPLVDRRGRHVEARRDLLRIVMCQHQPQTGALGLGQLLDASCGHGAMVARTSPRCTFHLHQDARPAGLSCRSLKLEESPGARRPDRARSRNKRDGLWLASASAIVWKPAFACDGHCEVPAYRRSGDTPGTLEKARTTKWRASVSGEDFGVRDGEIE